MAEEGLTVVRIHEDFYRDNFRKVILVIVLAVISILLVAAASLYLFLSKPPPVTFMVAKEWRVQAPVPLDQPYLADADVLQWVSNIIPRSFELDFLHYNQQLEGIKQYFTESGYEVFLNQLKNRFDKNELVKNKMFVNSEPTAAPFFINQGILTGRYAWWVQIPIKISYAGMKIFPEAMLTLQVLVVRTDTSDNLTGILIDNVIVDAKTKSGMTGK